MKVTIDVDQTTLASIKQITGEPRNSSAVKKFVVDYLDHIRREDLVRRVMNGETDYSLTNDELEAMIDLAPRQFNLD